MAVQMLRIFPSTGIGSDGFPTPQSPVPLIPLTSGQNEVTLVKVGYTPNIESESLQGDDLVEETDSTSSYTLDIEAHGISAAALVALGFMTRDSNNNLIPVVKPTARCTIFVRHADQKGGIRETWYYDVHAVPRSETFTTQKDGSVTDPISFQLKGSLIHPTGFADGIAYAEVQQGNTGFIGKGNEPAVGTFYKPSLTTTSSNSGSGSGQGS